MDKKQTNNPTKKSKQTNKKKKREWCFLSQTLAKNGVSSYDGQSYFKLESHEL